jgi:cation:H+ antiporter
MVWVKFLISSAIIVFAAIKLAEYGDIISIRTKLGGAIIGLILMAGATSLPEMLTTINSINQNVPDLAAGNMLGSGMFNMLLLGIMDLLNYRVRILRKVARRHALTGSMAAFLMTLATFFIMANINIKIGWVGLDSIILILTYVVGIKIIRDSVPAMEPTEEFEVDEKLPSLRKAIIGFLAATGVLALIMPTLVTSSSEIAVITGLGTGFVGTALVAFVTSLPELVTTITAVRLGVYDMAIGNLFVSNMFNIFALGLADFFMLDGRFLGNISPEFMIVAMIGLIMTLMGLIGNLARLEKRIFMLELDAALLILTYFAGMVLIYIRGIGI